MGPKLYNYDLQWAICSLRARIAIAIGYVSTTVMRAQPLRSKLGQGWRRVRSDKETCHAVLAVFMEGNPRLQQSRFIRKADRCRGVSLGSHVCQPSFPTPKPLSEAMGLPELYREMEVSWA